MKINYADINIRAAARKKKLQSLAKDLQALPRQAEILVDALSYFTKIKRKARELDCEGREILGGELFDRVNGVGDAAYRFTELLAHGHASKSTSNLSLLVAYVAPQEPQPAESEPS